MDWVGEKKCPSVPGQAQTGSLAGAPTTQGTWSPAPTALVARPWQHLKSQNTIAPTLVILQITTFTL